MQSHTGINEKNMRRLDAMLFQSCQYHKWLRQYHTVVSRECVCVCACQCRGGPSCYSCCCCCSQNKHFEVAEPTKRHGSPEDLGKPRPEPQTSNPGTRNASFRAGAPAASALLEAAGGPSHKPQTWVYGVQGLQFGWGPDS